MSFEWDPAQKIVIRTPLQRKNERTRKREKVGKEEITNTDTCRMKKGNTTIDIH